MVGPGWNGHNNYNRGGSGDRYNSSFSRQQPRQPQTTVPLPEKKILPEAYVDEAEHVMRSLLREDRHGNPVFDVSISQIRKILSLITDILNDENLSRAENISDESYQKLQMARVRIAYDAGREPKVKAFVDKSGLLSYIKGVEKNRAEFIRFARYVEALVAWHRYMGGSN